MPEGDLVKELWDLCDVACSDESSVGRPSSVSYPVVGEDGVSHNLDKGRPCKHNEEVTFELSIDVPNGFHLRLSRDLLRLRGGWRS